MVKDSRMHDKKEMKKEEIENLINNYDSIDGSTEIVITDNGTGNEEVIFNKTVEHYTKVPKKTFSCTMQSLISSPLEMTEKSFKKIFNDYCKFCSLDWNRRTYDIKASKVIEVNSEETKTTAIIIRIE